MAASDSRISVLLDPESAQTSLGVFVFLVYVIILFNGELIQIEDAGSVFLPWPTRQAFPPGGEVLDLEFR